MSQFPAWAAGSKITAGGLTNMEPLTAIKAGPTTITSNTTVAADPELQLTINNTGTYVLLGYLAMTGAAIGTGDMKLTFAFTGTTTFSSWCPFGVNIAGATSVNFAAPGFTSTQPIGVNGATVTGAHPTGMFTVSTTGTVQLQWAQNTSSGTGTVLRQGSWLCAWQIA